MRQSARLAQHFEKGARKSRGATFPEQAFDRAFIGITQLRDLGGRIEHGEMALRDTGSGTILPTSMFVRWSRG